MNIKSKALLLLSTAVFAGHAFAANVAEGGVQAKQIKELISLPAADLKWNELPGSGGVKYANVRGNLAGKGPYEAFVIFPAGKNNPYHLHTQNLPTVVLKGTFYAIIDGKRTEYPAGSFYNLPANLHHFSGCTPAEDCLLFQYQANHFDLVPAAEKK